MPSARVIELRNNGEIRFFEGSNGAEKVTVKAAASLAADRTIVLPSGAPVANQFVQTDGSGNWTYAAGTSTLQQAYDAATPNISIGAGGFINIDRATGGEVLRLRASTSGDPYMAVIAGTSEVRLGTTASASGFVGTQSSHSFEVRTNATARMTINNSGFVGINTFPSAGIFLRVLDTASNDVALFEKTGTGSGSVVTINNSGVATNLVINKTGGLAGGAVTITTNGVGHALTIAQNDTTGAAAGISLTCASTAHHGIVVTQNATAKFGIDITNAASAIVAALHITSQGSSGIQVDQSGSGNGLIISKTSTGTPAAVSVTNAGTASPALSVTTTSTSSGILARFLGNNGQYTSIEHQTATLDVTGSASPAVFTNLIPRSCLVLAVTARVTTTVTGSSLTSLDVGDPTLANRWTAATTLGTAATSTSDIDHLADFTSPLYYNSARDIRLRGNGLVGNFTAGIVRLTVHYIVCQSPTS
jgi:hypothetical protein